jgi:hypothetical protein
MPIQPKQFVYAVSVRFDLTGAALQRLLDASATHYDGVCQAASKSGGFLVGWLNELTRLGEKELTPELVGEVQADGFELDTAVKILEQEPSRITRKTGIDLYADFGALHAALGHEHNRVNENLEGAHVRNTRMIASQIVQEPGGLTDGFREALRAAWNNSDFLINSAVQLIVKELPHTFVYNAQVYVTTGKTGHRVSDCMFGVEYQSLSNSALRRWRYLDGTQAAD